MSTAEQIQRKNIDGKGKTVREILFSRKFYIDYYQREYKWQTKQLDELVSDLTGAFSAATSRNMNAGPLPDMTTTSSARSSSARKTAATSSSTASSD